MVFLSSNLATGSFVLEVGRVLDQALKINVEIIYLFTLIFKLVYEPYLLLNLRQFKIYEFSLKYFKSCFVTILFKLRCNRRNLSGSVQISIINTRFCKLLSVLPTLNKFHIHTYILTYIHTYIHTYILNKRTLFPFPISSSWIFCDVAWLKKVGTFFKKCQRWNPVLLKLQSNITKMGLRHRRSSFR